MKTAIYLTLIFSIQLSSCSKKLTNIDELSTEQRETVYKVLKDVSYGSDAEQKMNTGIINFSGPVDGLDLVEKIFTEHEYELFSQAGKALFPAEGYESKENIALYEPITYFDKNDPPIFLWHGGKDDQIPPVTFERFVPMLRKDKDIRMFIPNGQHSPNLEEFENAYVEILKFLDEL